MFYRLDDNSENMLLVNMSKKKQLPHYKKPRTWSETTLFS